VCVDVLLEAACSLMLSSCQTKLPANVCTQIMTNSCAHKHANTRSTSSSTQQCVYQPPNSSTRLVSVGLYVFNHRIQVKDGDKRCVSSPQAAQDQQTKTISMHPRCNGTQA
jgi:hypothetical protein